MSEVKMKHLLQINYKSGTSMCAWFTKFDADTRGGSITSLDYTVHPESDAKIIMIGINDIESVYNLESVEC